MNNALATQQQCRTNPRTGRVEFTKREANLGELFHIVKGNLDFIPFRGLVIINHLRGCTLPKPP